MNCQNQKHFKITRTTNVMEKDETFIVGSNRTLLINLQTEPEV